MQLYITFNRVGTFSFFGNENILDFHHEKGQQMENNIRTGRWVVLEAHTGHQVNEEGVAPLSELRVMADRNPAWHQKVQIYNNPAPGVLGSKRHFNTFVNTFLPTLTHWKDSLGSSHQLPEYTGDSTFGLGTTTLLYRPNSRCAHKASRPDLGGHPYILGKG